MDYGSILIIDDSARQRGAIRSTLQQHGLKLQMLEAGDGLHGLKMALDNPVDLILCDLEMPGLDGFKFLAMKNAQERLRDIPVIILTSHEKQDIKVRGLEQGASDFVTKPFDTSELIARVKIQLKIKHLQDELRHRNELLQRLAVTDPLTDLANRRNLMNCLRKEFSRTQRLNTPLSLIMIDLDHFKRVNDTFGHQAGDRVLTTIGHLLADSVRPYDIAARYGGEEFSLLLPETEHKVAEQIAERVRNDICSLHFDGELSSLKSTASFGVASCPSSDIVSAEDLIRHADEALYRAKDQGRNRVVSAAA